MQLTETIIINKGSKYYKECERLTHLSKNLYNAALYTIRQEYIKNKKYLNFYALNNLFVKDKNIDYYALPAKVSQQTLKLVDQNFKSFFKLLKLKIAGKYTDPVKLPKYLNKTGHQVVIYTNQAISKKELKKHKIKLSGSIINLTIRETINNINQIRIVKHDTTNTFNIEIVYTVQEEKLLSDNKRYAAIDIGVNNLATVSSNVLKPFIINGKPLKSINQYFNKNASILKSKNKIKTNRYRSLCKKHKNKINDYLHKASRYIINQLVSQNINTLVVGKNKYWKQEINNGKQNNQNFISIPHAKFINLLKYKCLLVGINFIEHEEAYTSKCSFLDNEKVCKHEQYLGKRIKRGLFKSANNKLINADLNGSLNILKKAIGEFQYSIEVCSTPIVINLQ